MKHLYLVLLIGLVGCYTNTPTPGWRIQNDTMCFIDPEGVQSWKHCADFVGEEKTNCQVKKLMDHYGQPFEKTPVSVFYHAPNGISKVKIMAGSHQDEELYCPTERVWK